MEELKNKCLELKKSISVAMDSLKIDEKSTRLKELDTQISNSNFWNDPENAKKVSKEQSVLSEQVGQWRGIKKNIDEINELLELNDLTLKSDLEKQLVDLDELFLSAKKELHFSGPYDDHEVVIGLHAGAGGTDAQDWTSMLLRMYVRWAENHKIKVRLVEQSSGDEAGLKSALLELSGSSYLYGKLKGENGVHRLVRLSPFNSDNLRQTSFAKVEVLPKIESPSEINLDEKDLKIDVYRSGGHGGQSVNTTDSAVRITHIPTGIVVAIQNERSQLQNKETALSILSSRLAQLQLEQHKDSLDHIKGPNQSAEWGNQIRSYVLHPYKQVKDLRTGQETSDPESVLDGSIDQFINAYLEMNIS